MYVYRSYHGGIIYPRRVIAIPFVPWTIYLRPVELDDELGEERLFAFPSAKERAEPKFRLGKLSMLSQPYGWTTWILLTAMEYRYPATRPCFAKFSRKLGHIPSWLALKRGYLKTHRHTGMREERETEMRTAGTRTRRYCVCFGDESSSRKIIKRGTMINCARRGRGQIILWKVRNLMSLTIRKESQTDIYIHTHVRTHVCTFERQINGGRWNISASSFLSRSEHTPRPFNTADKREGGRSYFRTGLYWLLLPTRWTHDRIGSADE